MCIGIHLRVCVRCELAHPLTLMRARKLRAGRSKATSCKHMISRNGQHRRCCAPWRVRTLSFGACSMQPGAEAEKMAGDVVQKERAYPVSVLMGCVEAR